MITGPAVEASDQRREELKANSRAPLGVVDVIGN